jgi:hypothetical protein
MLHVERGVKEKNKKTKERGGKKNRYALHVELHYLKN